MAYIDKVFNKNFIEYASYVIKDRAIPHIEDGLKPVQRRILHSLYEMDDGKFHKVANAVGHCMKYHPHGDASIFSALVGLANKDMFIEKQGNYGNIFTGDEASAPRYIECRLTPLAKETIFNPEITEYEDSYDGRNKEPIVLPAKVPVLLAQGAEGIAVGMATRILPHNFIELLQAQIAYLGGDDFTVYPDFPTAGLLDVSEYGDGNGKVRARARLDTSDPKRILIKEIPYGTTTESLINSIEAAARKNKIKIAGISDYTAENVEIEVRLARGVHTDETVDALYAFTDCEYSVSVNLIVIRDNKPATMSVTDVLKYNADRSVELLKAELKIEEGHLKDKLHAKTLEQIFIENRVYKKIEDKTTPQAVVKAVFDGLKPFSGEIRREVTEQDVETLLKIPIRRISLYDINRAQMEMADIKKRLKEIKASLENIVSYAISFLQGVIAKYSAQYPRRTELVSFEKVDIREVAQRNLKMRYDRDTGYLGYEANGNVLFDVSAYDRVLVIRKTGMYSVVNAPDKLFVDKGMLYCGFISKDTVFTIVYKHPGNNYPFIKRCKIEQFILQKAYSLVPEGAAVQMFTTEPEGALVAEYKPKPRLRVLEETFNLADFLVKGVKAQGVRLANKEAKSVKLAKPGAAEE
ncbi:MAG TPA: DNA topoisomerase IV subunit A [Chitinivibrionales bacterium]